MLFPCPCNTPATTLRCASGQPREELRSRCRSAELCCGCKEQAPLGACVAALEGLGRGLNRASQEGSRSRPLCTLLHKALFLLHERIRLSTATYSVRRWVT